VPEVHKPLRGNLLDGGRNELAEIIDSLEDCLGRANALDLSLLVALIDHAIVEAKNQLTRS
jgi:hypothetical protein